MSDVPGRTGAGGWPAGDEEADALLAGGETDRDELASLEQFLQEVRAPHGGPVPRPSAELVRLFSEGPGGLEAPAGPTGSGRRRPAIPSRKPVRKMAKVAAATTTAALAVTLAAAAQVLPGTQARTPIGASSPATPVKVGAGRSVTTATSLSNLGAQSSVTIGQPSTSAAGRPPATARTAAEADVNTLSPDGLARLPLDVLRTLSGDNLGRLPTEVLATLPGDLLARLSADVLRTLPGDVLARLPLDALKVLPGDLLSRLPGNVLALLPLDVLRLLPADAQSQLPADVLRLLLLLGPPPPVTTSTTVAARP